MNFKMHGAVYAAFAILVAVSASTGAQESPQWAAGLRGGTWSIPNALLDRFLDEHPSVDGESFGITFCPLGESGATGVFSVVYALDYGSLSGSGVWRADDDEPEDQREGKASLDLLALTVNFIWDIMPEWRVHPYLGLGLGIAYADGQIPGEEGEEDETYKGPAPAFNLPIGLKANLTDNFSVNLEARWFTAGVVLGGGAAISW
jgi:opacity protein-like surface antigen